jgi:hypothetical protein
MNPKIAFLIATLLGCASSAICPAQVLPQQADGSKPRDISTAESLIDGQLAAYNRRDVEGFLSYYSDAAVLVNYPDQITDTGKEAMRVRYKKSFANPDVRATIAKRIVFGNFVIDHEQLTRAPAPGMIEAIAVYEIKDGKIVRVTFLNK